MNLGGTVDTSSASPSCCDSLLHRFDSDSLFVRKEYEDLHGSVGHSVREEI